MTIEIDQESGFCFGVVKAISTAEELLVEREGRGGGEVFCLGQIVHNRVEVERLSKRGLKSVTHSQLEELHASQVVLVRAHGEPPSTYALAARVGLQIVDATCPVVAKLQQTVREAWDQMSEVGGQVVIFGKAGHAEVVGLTGQIKGETTGKTTGRGGEEAIVVEGVGDLDKIHYRRPIYLLSQTTQPLREFRQVAEQIRKRAAAAGMEQQQVIVHDTICRQVSNREPHLREFAARHDAVVFVSGRNSSNGRALFEVCRAANPNCHWIEEAAEIQSSWFSGVQSVGICGATSTPKWLMEEVAAAVRST